MVRWVTHLVFVAALLPATVRAASVGRVVNLHGEARVEHTHAEGASEPLAPGQEVHEGDLVVTAAGATMRLLMRDKGILDLGGGARLKLRTYQVNATERRRTVHLQLVVGRLWARVTKALGSGSQYEVTTTNAVAGVRGTEFVVDVGESGKTAITVVEGSVHMSGSVGDGEGQTLGAMQRGRVENDGSVTVELATAAEVRELESSVRQDSNLDAQDSAARLDGAAAGGGGGGAAGAPEEEAPETPDVGGPPPIDLDPSTGNTRVRGSLEVRE
jgi:hypothetical protein